MKMLSNVHELLMLGLPAIRCYQHDKCQTWNHRRFTAYAKGLLEAATTAQAVALALGNGLVTIFPSDKAKRESRAIEDAAKQVFSTPAARNMRTRIDYDG